MKIDVKDDIVHLQWIYDRLVNIHGENPNHDYMHRLKKIIDDLKRLNNDTPESVEWNELDKTLEAIR